MPSSSIPRVRINKTTIRTTTNITTESEPYNIAEDIVEDEEIYDDDDSLINIFKKNNELFIGLVVALGLTILIVTILIIRSLCTLNGTLERLKMLQTKKTDNDNLRTRLIVPSINQELDICLKKSLLEEVQFFHAAPKKPFTESSTNKNMKASTSTSISRMTEPNSKRSSMMKTSSTNRRLKDQKSVNNRYFVSD